MDSREQEIKKLRKLVRDLNAEIAYLKSPLYLHEITEIIQNKYSILLNPSLQEFSTTQKGKSCSFEIDINDIVCVKSDGKTKNIYFIEKQLSIDGIKHESDKLDFTGKINDFCKKYDSAELHLCIVSRSVAVNPKYYSLNSNRLLFSGAKNPQNSCDNIPITKQYVRAFIDRKATLDKLVSFQKIQFRSK